MVDRVDVWQRLTRACARIRACKDGPSCGLTPFARTMSFQQHATVAVTFWMSITPFMLLWPVDVSSASPASQTRHAVNKRNGARWGPLDAHIR
jgi:hypothetical protein